MKDSIIRSACLVSCLIFGLSSALAFEQAHTPSPHPVIKETLPQNFSSSVSPYAVISSAEVDEKYSSGIDPESKPERAASEKQRKKPDIRKFYLRLLTVIATQ